VDFNFSLSESLSHCIKILRVYIYVCIMEVWQSGSGTRPVYVTFVLTMV